MSLYRVVRGGEQLCCFSHLSDARHAVAALKGHCSVEKLVHDSLTDESWFEPIRAHSKLSDALHNLYWKLMVVSTDLMIYMKGV